MKVLDEMMAIQERIDEHDARGRRLRAERTRLFHPGHLYVVQFDSGVVKVGRADNVESRLKAHALTGLVRRSWSSPRHLHCNETERQLIAFCNEYGTLYGGREYFLDLPLDATRAYAALLVQNALRREYLDGLIDAADNDLSWTWQQAHEAAAAANPGAATELPPDPEPEPAPPPPPPPTDGGAS